ncbi:MAG: RNA polymerase factor sigma-70, partial [Planctomycetes bacterium]|nr:RNA polymerase factor sigma-70 [Planctomycetota bacterium]
MWPEADKTEQLLADAGQGDADAINRLMDRHRDALHRMVQMRLDQKIKQRVDVSDVVQDVLIEANRRLKDYLANPVMSFHLWLRQIAKDRIIDAHRRHRVSAKRSVDREQQLVVPATMDHSTMELAAQLCDP